MKVLRISREQSKVLSALLVVTAFLSAANPLCVIVLFAAVVTMLLATGLWRPLPAMALRSVLVLAVLVMIPHLIVGNRSGGIVATGKILGLFCISLLLLRGIGVAGLFRTFQRTFGRSQLLANGVENMVFMPFLMSRFNYHWKNAKVLVFLRIGERPKMARWLYQLKALFLRVQIWPTSFQMVRAFRNGASRRRIVTMKDSPGWQEIALFMGSLACLGFAVSRLRLFE